MPPRSAHCLKKPAASPWPLPVRCPFLYTVRCRNLLSSSLEGKRPRQTTRLDVVGRGGSWKGFTTSGRLANPLKSKNHYERLNVQYDATPAEIKKSFYALSKVHHPDANRNDPTAAQTFSLLSESYTLLSDPQRRTAYDRDVLRLQQSSQQATSQPSYHSSANPAGGRPASGLSKRRGTFRGPPPSFYRSGGWGDQTEKRQKAHDESTGGAAHAGSHSAPRPAHERTTPGSRQRHQHHHHHGGMGPGSDPFGHDGDVPHFDKRATQQTQHREDERRRERSRRVTSVGAQSDGSTGTGGLYILILSVLAFTFLTPVIYLRSAPSARKKADV